MKRIRRRSSGPIRLPGLFSVYSIYTGAGLAIETSTLLYMAVLRGEVRVMDLNVFFSIHIKIA